jgi:two-component system sensor histidine kinase DesK
MTTLASPDHGTARWARYLLLAANASVIIAPIGYALAYSRAITTPGLGLVPIALGLAIAALHGRHTLAATRGQRPRGGRWTLSLLALLIYPPLLWIGLSWGITQTTLIASSLIVLRRRARFAAVGLVLLAVTSYSTYAYWGRGGVARLLLDVAAALALDAHVGVAL